MARQIVIVCVCVSVCLSVCVKWRVKICNFNDAYLLMVCSYFYYFSSLASLLFYNFWNFFILFFSKILTSLPLCNFIMHFKWNADIFFLRIVVALIAYILFCCNKKFISQTYLQFHGLNYHSISQFVGIFASTQMYVYLYCIFCVTHSGKR